MIDKATINHIIATADIVEVVNDFVTLKKKGVNYTACCPFHNEKTPSFIVSPTKGLYKCFGCGKGGGAVNFVMEHEKLSYPDALRWLGKKYNIEIQETQLTKQQIEQNNDKESMLVLNSWADTFFNDQLYNTAQGQDIALSYLTERGFNAQTIKRFSAGYCPNSSSNDTLSQQAIKEGFAEKFLTQTGLTIIRETPHKNKYYDRFAGRVIFPIHSLTGRIIGFGGRIMSNDKKTAKYLNSPQSDVYDKSQSLYGIFQAKKAITQKDRCILVEGYTDVMQMHQSGVENVVSSSGTALTEYQIKLIKRFSKNITVIYDGDQAGIKASLRGIDMMLKEGVNVKVVPLPEGDDPDSFARRHTASELEQYIALNEEDFLRFKTRILLGDGNATPSEKAALINDIVQSIASIEDNITREVYIKQCAKDLDISYDVLSRAVVTAIIAIPNPRAIPRPRDTDARSDAPKSEEQLSRHPDTGTKGHSSLVVLEGELTGYLVKYGAENFKYELSTDNIVEMPVAETIIQELDSDSIEFETPCYAAIMKLYREGLRRGAVPTTGELLSSEDFEISQTVADILAKDEAHTASVIWDRYDMSPESERALLWKSVPKAILLYKSKVVESRIEDLQRSLNEDLDIIDQDKIEQIKEYNAIRQSILERYKRLR